MNTPQTCQQIQAAFSAYLDGAVPGHTMQEIARHLEGTPAPNGLDPDGLNPDGLAPTPACDLCAREFAAWRSTQDALACLGPAKPPADLGLKLRLAISRERARRNSRLLDQLSLRWDNAIRPLVMQAAAGVAATTLLVGSIMVLLGAVAPANNPVLADDESLSAITPPHYLYSAAAPGAIVCRHDAPIIVEASVNAAGRVYDYTIVSGPEDDTVRTQIATQLLGQVFQPATVFGAPVRGRVVVTFAGISVRG